jgi:hypothetical protein
MDFGGRDYYKYQETLPQEQQQVLDKYCYTTGHKVGGYTIFKGGPARLRRWSKAGSTAANQY